MTTSLRLEQTEESKRTKSKWTDVKSPNLVFYFSLFEEYHKIEYKETK